MTPAGWIAALLREVGAGLWPATYRRSNSAVAKAVPDGTIEGASESGPVGAGSPPASPS
jgi:hypothetical protein